MTTKEKALSYLQCLGTRNMAEITKFFGAEVDWLIPGDEKNVPWIGRRKTKAEVTGFYESLWSSTEALGATINFVGTDGDLAIITGSFETKMLRTGLVVNSLFMLEIEFAGSLIKKYRLLEDTLQVSQAMNL